MPKRTDIKKVVILGSGPIVIGQACEFDYSGTQACKALMQEGYEVILINSNPATIMTDPEQATRVYVEPLKLDFVTKILEKEKPDALIPTLGGQTALNLGLELSETGVLKRLNIELLGAKAEVIHAAEDREKFARILDQVGAQYPRNIMVRNFDDGLKAANELGFPLVMRPNFTLGGGGGGIAYSLEEYTQKLTLALHESPTSECLIEESILGWKEFELEVMRDRAGTFVVICSIENIDPCGVHTGDSITVAPQQTLSDREYQAMRDEARKIINAVGVETGGANIQFAVDPENGRRVVIEMNPRVSRSSALASKATGFPIAKIAALLAVGYELEELNNDITRTTKSCYEPALDYVVTKIPRFAFEKFTGSKDLLSTQMKSVGEVMAIGRTFQESLMKAVLSLERDARGPVPVEFDKAQLAYPNSQRLFFLFQAFRNNLTVEQVYEITRITPWFLEQIKDLVDYERALKLKSVDAEHLLEAKRKGFSDAWIAELNAQSVATIRQLRRHHDIRPAYLQVDTCAGEFASQTPYFYSTYWAKPKPQRAVGKTVAILGSGPNRIGQGIEFDYSCVRSVKEFQRQGHSVAMINSNPETVSTDYDTSDELFFEPLTEEHVGEILNFIQPTGFVAQLGGQTPIQLAPYLVKTGYKLLGSNLDTMDWAEDRSRFAKLCRDLKIQTPESGLAHDYESAQQVADRIGYPVICRPSYVLGGRRMEIVENDTELKSYFQRHGHVLSTKNQCFIDQFLEQALEIDVDLVRGKDWTVIGGVIEHIEAAGVHSGDSMGVLPPQRLRDDTQERVQKIAMQIADQMNVLGFLNLQIALKNDEIYLIEANPRSSRSVPFIAKATQIPIVNLGVRAMLGATAKDIKPEQYKWYEMKRVAVKGVVFPFKKFPEADALLGPEMKSTGETMGRGEDYSEALMKALVSSGAKLPQKGEVFLSLREKDKDLMLPLIQELKSMGYDLSGTFGTAEFLKSHGVDCEPVRKVHQGRPNCVDRIRSGQVALVINTTSGREAIEASFGIRRSCVDYSVPCITESDAAAAFLLALKKIRSQAFSVYHL